MHSSDFKARWRVYRDLLASDSFQIEIGDLDNEILKTGRRLAVEGSTNEMS
jgi:hypothetical protein